MTFEVYTNEILTVKVKESVTNDSKMVEINRSAQTLTTSQVIKLQKEADAHKKDCIKRTNS